MKIDISIKVGNLAIVINCVENFTVFSYSSCQES